MDEEKLMINMETCISHVLQKCKPDDTGYGRLCGRICGKTKVFFNDFFGVIV